MVSELFVEDQDGDVIYLDLYEKVFQLVSVPIYYALDDQYVASEFSIQFWRATEQVRKVDPLNPPLLGSAPHEQQLGVSNAKLLKAIWEEALLTESYGIDEEKENHQILICDLHKLLNLPHNDPQGNRWVVWRMGITPQTSYMLNEVMKNDYLR